MAGFPGHDDRLGRPQPRPLHHAAAAGARPRPAPGVAVADRDRLRQHDPGRAGAVVPRRRRPGAEVPAAGPLERSDHGAPRAASRRRRRRPHLVLRLVGDAVRGGLQPLLPRQGPPRRRRPDLLPGPRQPRHVRPGLPRGTPRRGRPERLPAGEEPPRRRPDPGAAVLPAPAADARASGSSRPCRWASARSTAIYQAQFNKYLRQPGPQGHRRPAASGRSSATARWTRWRAAARCNWRPTRAWTT